MVKTILLSRSIDLFMSTINKFCLVDRFDSTRENRIVIKHETKLTSKGNADQENEDKTV